MGGNRGGLAGEGTLSRDEKKAKEGGSLAGFWGTNFPAEGTARAKALRPDQFGAS